MFHRRNFLIAAALLLLPVRAFAQDLTVFAAASLTDSMKDVATIWEAQGHPKLRQSFASSSTLAKQIEQGAGANLFASADPQWMDYLKTRDLLANDSIRTLLGNSLVLVMPRDKVQPVQIGPGWNLMALLGPGGRLAVGDPTNVPAGIYANTALTRLGLWEQVKAHLASAEDVRGALLLVSRGEAPAGIVYSTDAAVDHGVAIAGTFPENTHDPIQYPFAVTRAGDTPEARALLAYLAGPQATAVFVRRGFRTE